MRFIHTADWQIGMKAAHVGSVGDRVRRERMEAARRVVTLARENDADFIVLAGDTFEDNAVGSVIVRQVAELLGSAGRPAFVLPGNHDPLVPGSVWDHPVWAEGESLHVLRKREPLSLPGATLYPCPAFDRQSGADPTQWIPSSGEGIRVGVAHGTIEGVSTDERSFPIARDADGRTGLDYLALGHWHSTVLFPNADGDTRMAYCGSHEPTKFGERDSGNVLLVEIAGPGAPPQVRSLPSGGLTWCSLEYEVREPEDLGKIRSDVEGLKHPAATLVDLRLRGILPAAALEPLEQIREILAARFLYHRIDDAELHPHADDPSWVAQLPTGILRQVAEGLISLSDPAQGIPGTERPSPQVAMRALLELHALAQQEAGRQPDATTKGGAR